LGAFGSLPVGEVLNGGCDKPGLDEADASLDMLEGAKVYDEFAYVGCILNTLMALFATGALHAFDGAVGLGRARRLVEQLESIVSKGGLKVCLELEATIRLDGTDREVETSKYAIEVAGELPGRGADADLGASVVTDDVDQRQARKYRVAGAC
jgi:hypothetical protein